MISDYEDVFDVLFDPNPRFLSGGVAGTIASVITNPLEVVKTQLQSSNAEISQKTAFGVGKQIFERNGLAGFFKGLSPTLVGIIPSRSAYFYGYQRSKTFLNPKLPEGSPGNALVSGLLAGIAGNTLTNPIWMVRTRMQLMADNTAGQRNYAGYVDAIKTIFKDEGLGGFYKGITASYWGCAEGALQFIVYEQIKSRLLSSQNEQRIRQGLPETSELPKATYFWAAAASKALAAIATYPHEVARTRMREQARGGVFKYKGMWQTLGVMAKEEGTKSLHSGMGIHLVKVVPNSATMFLCYEMVRGYLATYDTTSSR